MAVNRVKIAWSNWPGAPGYTNLYLSTSVADLSPIRAFFNTISTYLPAAVTIQVPSSGDTISESTGTIIGAWTATGAGSAVTGGVGNTGAYAGSAGAQVQWQTTLIARGRRIQGRSFIVPLYSSGYDSNGSLSSTAQNGIASAAATMIAATSPQFYVWSRPAPGYTGQIAVVTSARVPDLAVVLRSRRT